MAKASARQVARCRVCGCTQNNACVGGCWWVEVEPNSPPLCSACSGTPGDLAMAISWIIGSSRAGANSLKPIAIAARAALNRYRARQQ